MKKSAVVLLSGGLDSAVCFFSAINKYDHVIALSFDYGQRNRVELRCAYNISEFARCFMRKSCEHILQSIEIPKGTSVPSALTSERCKLQAEGGYKNMPTSFVPGRNLLFLSFACTQAMVRGIDHVITGVNTFPNINPEFDTRPAFIKSFIRTFHEATMSDVKVLTPLMGMSKAEVFAVHCGSDSVFEFLVANTMSCYERESLLRRHPWGMGCGKCTPCKVRSKGWKEFKRDQKRTK